MTLEEHLERENKFKCGWLSPNGDFYPCHSYDHLDKARTILKKKWSECHNPDDVLMDAGWVYIGIASFFSHEWRIGWRKFLTDYQINFLRPYFEESSTPVNDMAVFRWKREVEKEQDDA